jgi:putative transposase
MIQRAYKTKLVVNNHEANYFRGCAGLARFVYNWGLAEAKRRYEKTGKTPSPRNVLKKEFNAIKREQFPWTADYPYVIVQSAFDDLDAAYKNFFRRAKAGETPGYPRFKARGRDMSFRFVGAGITVEEARVKLPRIGWVRLAERGYLPVGAEVNSATISWRAGNWSVSVQVEEPAPEPVELRPVTLGVELGIRLAAVATAADADGNLVGEPTVYENPRVLDKHARKLARLNRELSRRHKGGANWRKTQAKIARQYERITRARDHAQHNVSADIVRRKRPAEIVIAGHEVAKMMKRPKPVEAEDGGFERNEAEVTRPRRRKMADVRMGELRRQIEYKAGWSRIAVERPEAGYPATRMCSVCGFVNAELPLRETVLHCARCGARIDRDVNAARNLAARREPVKHGGLPGELGGEPSTVNQEAGSPE